MMKCTQCGSEFEGAFCPECGAPAQQTPAEQAPVPAEQAPVEPSVLVCPRCGTVCAEGAMFCSKCGSPLDAQQAAQAEAKAPRSEKRRIAEVRENKVRAEVARDISALPEGYKMPKPMQEQISDFTGGAVVNFFMKVALFLGTLCSLGIAYPALLCWQMRWEVRHTYMNGRQLVFDGKAYMLYGSFLKWFLLSIITVGIYGGFVMPLNVLRWKTKHTHVLGVTGHRSKFTGSVMGRWWCNVSNSLLTIITIGIGWFWTRCRKRRWYAEHTVIDDCTVIFDGRAKQYFGKCIVWLLLTVVTIGIYSVWLLVKTKQWTAYHTKFAREEVLPTPEAQAISVVREAEVQRRLKEERKKEGAGMTIAGAFNLAGFLCFFVAVLVALCTVDFGTAESEMRVLGEIAYGLSFGEAFRWATEMINQVIGRASVFGALLGAGIVAFIGFGLSVAGAVLNRKKKTRSLRKTGGWGMALNGVVMTFNLLFVFFLPNCVKAGGNDLMSILLGYAVCSLYGAAALSGLVAASVGVHARRGKGKIGGCIAAIVICSLILAIMIGGIVVSYTSGNPVYY